MSACKHLKNMSANGCDESRLDCSLDPGSTPGHSTNLSGTYMATTFSKRRFLRESGVGAASVSVAETFRSSEDIVSASFDLYIPSPFDKEAHATYRMHLETPWSIHEEYAEEYSREHAVAGLERITEEANEYANNIRHLAEMLTEFADAVDTSVAEMLSRTIDRMAKREKAQQPPDEA